MTELCQGNSVREPWESGDSREEASAGEFNKSHCGLYTYRLLSQSESYMGGNSKLSHFLNSVSLWDKRLGFGAWGLEGQCHSFLSIKQPTAVL